MEIYATITLEMTRAGIFATCKELDKEVFIAGDKEGNSLEKLVELINEAETYCSPDTMFVLTEKGKREVEKLRNE